MLTRTRRTCRDQAGITLIEILVSMIILGVISTMLIIGWVNLQRASATVLRTSNARSTARDAMSRISSELRGAQPTALPTASPTPTLPPSITLAAPMEVQFSSAFNRDDANWEGSGVGELVPTRIWLDPTLQSPPWNVQCRTLYWQRDTNGDGSFTGTGDRSIVLARNVANDNVPSAGYTAVFMYGYRTSVDQPVLWTDNDDNSLDLSTVVAVSVRLIINKKMGGRPSYVDLSSTVRLRNVSSE